MSTATITKTGLPSGTWAIDTAHTKVGFAVKHMGVSTVRGEFHDYDGVLEVDENGQLHARGKVKVASVNTNQAQRDEHLRSADFFDADNHPQLRFASTAITPIDAETFEIEGELTMRGETRPITLKAEVAGTETDPWGNERVGLEITGQLSRGEYGMTFNQALGSGNVLVSDKVKLRLDISAVKQA